ncbi:MAG: cyclic nucleotide-binding domain-containing protein [Acidimicrobiales bacterium]|nr:cyclic nucleotide-binding domain-containing protein [Acidimicrobiales bacterium]
MAEGDASTRMPMADNPLFAGINDDEKERLNKLAEPASVNAGDHIIEQGEIGRQFVLLVDGTADVVRDGEVVAHLEPGDFFGEMALLGMADGVFKRTASVVATTDCTLEVMASAAFDTALANFPEAAAAIRLRAMERWADNRP